jgi:aspartate aminotransferase
MISPTAPRRMHLSKRARTLRPSPTLALDARVKDMIRTGADVVNLGAGEPDFDTPEAVVEAAHRAAKSGRTKYTAVAGQIELREAIAAHVRKTHGIAVEASNIVVTNGAKQALYNSLQALVDPGDEVAIVAPYWVSYPDMIELAGGRAIVVPSVEPSFEPDTAALVSAITPRTRGIVINTPNNPTGAVYSRESLAEILRIARERDLWILSDEIYEMLVYDGRTHVSPASIGTEGLNRTIVASGFSKSYAMTGWRLGYMAAPRAVAEAAATIQGQMTSNVNTPAQWAGVAALNGDATAQRAMISEFEARRTLLVEGLQRALRGNVQIPMPRGAFYLLMDARPWLGRECGNRFLATDLDLAEAILERARVALVPGTAFGAPGFIRMSYATSRENLQKAVERLAAFLNEL